MAQFPILPFYTDAYLGDTTHLTTTEHGAYFLLLLTAWRSPLCRLPDDDRMLARYSKMTLDKWQKCRVILEQFYEIKDGYWYQNKLLATHEQISKRSQSQSDSANAKWRKYKQTAHATALPNVCQTDAIHIQSQIKEEEPPIVPPLKEVNNAKRKQKPTSFITEDFRGDIGSIALAGKLGIDFEREQRKFIDHYLAKGESRADWDASFRTWLNRAAEFGAERRQRETAGRQGVRDVTGAALHVIKVREQAKANA